MKKGIEIDLTKKGWSQWRKLRGNKTWLDKLMLRLIKLLTWQNYDDKYQKVS